MTPKCRTQNQASCLLCKARGGFCIDKLYNPPHTEGILALPDLIALSWSLYALSQDKNDPNTNPEIITCSRKDIFVDISWITAKKIFFFFLPIHPFKVLLQTRPKLSGSHPKWPKRVPASCWEGAPSPIAALPAQGKSKYQGTFCQRNKKEALKTALWFTFALKIWK